MHDNDVRNVLNESIQILSQTYQNSVKNFLFNILNQKCLIRIINLAPKLLKFLNGLNS